MKARISLIAAFAGFGLTLAHADGVCRVESGPTRAALVELYTSEGCSSCPPADDTLRQIRRSVSSQAAIIPIALHVSYWDQIGWKDVFAQKAFDSRQSALVSAGKGKVVYTPQFFVNGREVRSWNGALPDVIGKASGAPAQARITLQSTPLAGNVLLVDAAADARMATGNRALYVALSENDLVSHVTRGENSGATLRHDATVRRLIGPIALANGNARIREEIRLAPDWNPDHLQAVAFVQDQDDGGVLQAVSTARCMAGSLASRSSH